MPEIHADDCEGQAPESVVNYFVSDAYSRIISEGHLASDRGETLEDRGYKKVWICEGCFERSQRYETRKQEIADSETLMLLEEASNYIRRLEHDATELYDWKSKFETCEDLENAIRNHLWPEGS